MEIKRISENLMEIPYGRSIRNGEKILPPHYQQYANEMKRLINLLLSLYNLDNDCILVSEMNQIQSLYDNEIRQAIIDKDQRMREFYEYRRSIVMQRLISWLLDNNIEIRYQVD